MFIYLSEVVFVRCLHCKVPFPPISFFGRRHYVHSTFKGWELCSSTFLREEYLRKIIYNSSIWAIFLSLSLSFIIDLYQYGLIDTYTLLQSNTALFVCSNCFSRIGLSAGSCIPWTYILHFAFWGLPYILAPGLTWIFPAPALESISSPTSPGFFDWRVDLEPNIWVWVHPVKLSFQLVSF